MSLPRRRRAETWGPLMFGGQGVQEEPPKATPRECRARQAEAQVTSVSRREARSSVQTLWTARVREDREGTLGCSNKGGTGDLDKAWAQYVMGGHVCLPATEREGSCDRGGP